MTCVLVLPDLNESRLENRSSNEALGPWDEGYRLYGTCLNFRLKGTTKDQVEMIIFFRRWVEILNLRGKASLI